jgi:hypothetical protein
MITTIRGLDRIQDKLEISRDAFMAATAEIPAARQRNRKSLEEIVTLSSPREFKSHPTTGGKNA